MKKTRAVLPSPSSTGDFINESEIFEILNRSKRYEDQQVRDIFHKALQLQGLNLEEVAILCSISDPELIHELFQTAKKVKEEIYGKRLVIFAPLYVSNLCSNECLYCAFRARNTTLKRRSLSYEEIAQEVQVLLNQGHKRVLLVAGEAYPQEGFDYILKAIEIIYAQKTPKGEK
ncbi:MAG: radical SAM protein [Candidatus Bathyarchaeia archaeon]